MLDDEAGALQEGAGELPDSPLGGDVKDALQLARDLAVRNAGQLARERYQRNLDELNEHLRDGAKILIDITAAAAQPARLSDRRRPGQRRRVARHNVVKPDDEHVIWPFDGEYWRDELGFYRQTITSKCGR